MTGVEQTITVKTTEGDHEVRAYVVGNWAAHHAQLDDGNPRRMSTVTYVPSGRCITDRRQMSSGRARRLALALAAQVPDLPAELEAMTDEEAGKLAEIKKVLHLRRTIGGLL